MATDGLMETETFQLFNIWRWFATRIRARCRLKFHKVSRPLMKHSSYASGSREEVLCKACFLDKHS